MNSRNLFILLAIFMVIGCGQSESEPESAADNQTNEVNSEAPADTESTPDNSEPKRVGKILAKVNGVPIYQDDLNGKSLEYVISEEVIYQAGLERGINKQYEDEVREYERMLVIRGTKEKLLDEIGPTKDISDEEIEKYYQDNKHKYSNIRIHEIAFPDVNMGEDIKQKAISGIDLQEIATSYPDDAITVSDMGYNRQLAKEFEVVEVGSVSDVTQKENGTFRILKIVEIKEVPLSASRNSIKHILESKRKGDMFEDYSYRLADENNIEVERLQ